VPVRVRDLGEQSGHGGNDATCGIVGVPEILLDDFCETVPCQRGQFFGFVFATEDHRRLNNPVAANAQGS